MAGLRHEDIVDAPVAATPHCYALLDPVKQALAPLFVGSNYIGRGAVPTQGDAYIFIESPKATVSRNHAVIQICENGDAWIADCGSTNGTFLAIRSGKGLRLEPNKFYQLSPDAQLMFSDVEMEFVLRSPKGHDLSSAPLQGEHEGATTSRAHSTKRSNGTETRETSLRASVAVKAVRGGSRSPQRNSTRDSAGSGRVGTPYLGDELPVSTGGNAARAKPRGTSSAGKRLRSPSTGKGDEGAKKKAHAAKQAEATKKAAKAPAKAPPPTATPSPPSARTTDKKRSFTACFSGMDSDEKQQARKALSAAGGKATESIRNADVLVVATPPTRTPKFLIAVGRGIPIVDVGFFASPQFASGGLAAAKAAAPTLHHNNHVYPASVLQHSIFRPNAVPLLVGREFHLATGVARSKATAHDIIEGCGGTLLPRRTPTSIELNEVRLEELYDCILRGSLTFLDERGDS